MASNKKQKKPTKDYKGPPISRPGSEGDSPSDPGYPLPTPAPRFREDFPPNVQAATEKAMARAGREVYGSPITMEDATQARVTSIQNAVDRSENGIPDRLGWYGGHNSEHRSISRDTGIRPGAVIDTSANLSPRNRPANELKAARSAAFIAANPNHVVDITEDMAPHVGEMKKQEGKTVVTSRLQPGRHRLGDLTDDEAASLGFAETAAIRGEYSEDETPPTVSDSDRKLPRSVTDVTLLSAGRPRASKAIKITRGKTLDEVSGAAPKMRNYARASHKNPDQSEHSYNSEVFWRRKQVAERPNEQFLFPANELLRPDQRGQREETVEDYVMYSMTADAAAKEQKKGNKTPAASKAQDKIKIKKTTADRWVIDKKTGERKNVGGRSVFPADLEPDEIGHAFNEEATRRSSEHFGYTGWVNGEQFSEHITARGAQEAAWVEQQRHVLNEDEAFNAAKKSEEKAAAKKAKTDAAWAKRQKTMF